MLPIVSTIPKPPHSLMKKCFDSASLREKVGQTRFHRIERDQDSKCKEQQVRPAKWAREVMWPAWREQDSVYP